MKMEQTVFRNVGISNSDAGELPKRKLTTFRTRRKVEIKNIDNFSSYKIQQHHILRGLATTLLVGGLGVEDQQNDLSPCC